MSNMVPFESAKLPAYLRAAATANTDLTANVGAGFGALSIKGKVFHVVRGGERTMLMDPDKPKIPATSIQIVILKANSALSKVFYSKGYVEGSDEKPDCFSNDGIAPDAEAQHPQATKCAACAKNQWGSKISEQGKKVKACADSRKLAVAPLGQLNDPMLLRVPAASLRPLAEYAKMLEKRTVGYNMVATELSFEFAEATPKLTFSPVSFLSEEQYAEVCEQLESDVVASIIGADNLMSEAVEEVKPEPVIAGTPPTSKKAAPAAQRKPEPVRESEPVHEPEPVVATVSDDLSGALDDILGGLDD